MKTHYSPKHAHRYTHTLDTHPSMLLHKVNIFIIIYFSALIEHQETTVLDGNIKKVV